MLGFILFFTALLVGAHFYLGLRLVRGMQLPRWQRRSVALGLGASFVLPLLGLAARDYVGHWLADGLILGGYLAMGSFGALFFLFLAKDLLWGLGRLLDRATPVLPQDPERRQLLQRAINLGVVGSAAGIGLVGFAQAQSAAAVEEVRVPIAELPQALEGFTVVQISDIHVGPTIRRERVQEIVDAVNALEPDLIAITGDRVDGSVPGLREQVAPLAQLRATHGVFFSTGNHEYYSGAQEWLDHCAQVLGMKVLVDAHQSILHAGARVVVGGVADLGASKHMASHRSDPFAAIQGAPDSPLRILLAHQPRSVYDAALAGWNLVLSGHTHAGQFFPFTLLIHLAQPFVSGLHRVENTWLYVNRGTTYWGPPIRLGAAQEITRLVLTRG